MTHRLLPACSRASTGSDDARRMHRLGAPVIAATSGAVLVLLVRR